MNMKDMIQRMTDLENQKTQLDESIIENDSGSIIECGDMPPAPMDRGNPVSISVNMNASGKEHVEDLINMMKNAGMAGAKEVDADMMRMRRDMERLRDIVDEPDHEHEEIEDEVEEWANSPEGSEDDVDYRDQDYMTNMMGDDLHKKKKAYAKAQDGDNAMAVESIKEQLLKALAEKKAKPDYLDMDKDGDKKEPMKKALKDKEKAKKESAPSDTDSLIAELNKQYELMLIGGKQAQLGLTASARVIADEVMYDGSRFVVAEVVDKGEEGLVAEDGSWEGETTPYRVAYHIVDDEIVGQVGAGEVPYLSRDGNGAFPVKHKLNNLDLNESNFFADYVSAVDKIKAMYEDLGNKMFGEVTATFGGCEMIRND